MEMPSLEEKTNISDNRTTDIRNNVRSNIPIIPPLAETVSTVRIISDNRSTKTISNTIPKYKSIFSPFFPINITSRNSNPQNSNPQQQNNNPQNNIQEEILPNYINNNTEILENSESYNDQIRIAIRASLNNESYEDALLQEAITASLINIEDIPKNIQYNISESPEKIYSNDINYIPIDESEILNYNDMNYKISENLDNLDNSDNSEKLYSNDINYKISDNLYHNTTLENHNTTLENHNTTLENHNTTLENHNTTLENHNTTLENHNTTLENHNTTLENKSVTENFIFKFRLPTGNQIIHEFKGNQLISEIINRLHMDLGNSRELNLMLWPNKITWPNNISISQANIQNKVTIVVSYK